MTRSEPQWFPPVRQACSSLAWPATFSIASVLLIGALLGQSQPLGEWLYLIPNKIFTGQVWRLFTGLFVQPAQWPVVAVAILASVLFARELEERRGARWLLAFVLSVGAVTGLGWALIQSAASTLGLQSGSRMPLVSYPIVTALAAYRTTQMPWARLGSTGYRVSAWIVASCYAISTCILLATEPWPVYLSAHLLALVLSGIWAYRAQLSLDRVVRDLHAFPDDRQRERVDALATVGEPVSDVAWTRRVDMLLAKITARGIDSLSSSERKELRDAAARLRRRGIR